MSTGFGVMPFGLGPFGLETPDDPPTPPTGTAGSRYINPATGDYEVDETTGQLKQMPRTRQRVLLALITMRRTVPTAPRFGANLPRKMGTSFEVEVRQSVALALQHLVNERAIDLQQIVVERGRNSRARVTVNYIDLDTDEPDFVETVIP